MFTTSSRFLPKPLTLCLVHSLLIVTLLTGLTGLTTDADAQVNPQRIRTKDEITGFYANLNLTLSYNLLGLRVLGDVGYRWRLYASQSKILRQNFVLLGATAALTPAWMEGGAFVTVQPLTILTLKAMYRFRFQIPAFFSGGAFTDINEVNNLFAKVDGHQSGEQVLRDQIAKVEKDNNGRVLPTSHIASIDAVLRFQLKGITALAFVRYEKWFNNFDDKYKVFYEGGLDIIMNKTDDVLTVNGLLGYQWNHLLFVVLTAYVRTFQANEEIWRLGPAVRWTLAPNWGPFKKPNILFVANWYLKHRWRAAALDGVPLIAVVFGGIF